MADLRKRTSRQDVSQLSHNFPKCVCALYRRAHIWETLGSKAALADARRRTTTEEET